MEILADRIAGYFISNGVAEERDRDIYVYGLMHAFSNGIGLAVAVVAGFAFSVPLEMLLFFATLAAFRMSAGGYHVGAVWMCIGASAMTFVVAAIIMRLCPAALYLPAIAVILVLSAVTVFKFAPVEDKNRRLSPGEVLKFRKRSRLLVAGVALILGTVSVLGGSFTYYSFCASLGISAATVSIPAALLKQKIGGMSNEKRQFR